jgi:hypothetical protein
VNWLVTPFVWIARQLRQVASEISSLSFKKKPRIYRAVRVEDLPDEPKPFAVYVAGEGSNAWAASMVCPCGCKEIIELNLLQKVRPRWRFVEHKNGAVSLEPSVWRQSGCRSHFVLREGLIRWCR